LVRDGKPTVASLLLFADEPQAALPKQSGIKIYRYATTDVVGSRETLQGQPQTVEGNVYAQIRQAVRTTVQLVEGIRVWAPRGWRRSSIPR
jgi:ATP-dependent DNA helicase RecG